MMKVSVFGIVWEFLGVFLMILGPHRVVKAVALKIVSPVNFVQTWQST